MFKEFTQTIPKILYHNSDLRLNIFSEAITFPSYQFN